MDAGGVHDVAERVDALVGEEVGDGGLVGPEMDLQAHENAFDGDLVGGVVGRVVAGVAGCLVGGRGGLVVRLLGA